MFSCGNIRSLLWADSFNSLNGCHLRAVCAATLSTFVPKGEEIDGDKLAALRHLISKAKNVFVLSGAGLSTASGIRDYRSEGVGLYSVSSSRPMNYSDFLKSDERRRMYWARNSASWPIFSQFQPNTSHRILASWEKRGKVFHHTTQNVDSLLLKAGCTKLTELHGSLFKVRCLNCDFKMSREAMQLLIKAANPEWHRVFAEAANAASHASLNKQQAPDGDTLLSPEQMKSFVLPECPQCKKYLLKPEVIFFGDSIPKHTTELVNEKLTKCDALLAVGTSLQVYSAYRIILKAKELGVPISIINVGETRGDPHAFVKINSVCSEVLSRLDQEIEC